MSKFLECCSIFLLIGVCLGQLPEYNVTHTDMPKPMREYAIAQSLLLLSNGTGVNVMAEELTGIMNLKYGKGWFSLVGTNTAINGLNTEKNTTLKLQYNATPVTLSQQKVELCNNSTQVNASTIFERARNSIAVQVFASNQTFCDHVINETQNTLRSHNYDGCLFNAKFNDRVNSCAIKTASDLQTRLGTNSQVTVGFDSLFGSVYYPGYKYCEFSLADINYDVRVIE